MRIVVTGVSGFIGRHLIRNLTGAGHSIVALGRTRPAVHEKLDFLTWDALKGPAPAAEFGRADAVVHLAGEPVAQRWNHEVKRRIRESRTVGTRNLVAGFEKSSHRPAVFVAASATGYYGDRGEEVLTEESPPGKGFLADVSVEWERESRTAERFGARVVLVRIGIVLGPQGGALQKMLTPFRLGIGGWIGTGRQWMSWIHLDDLGNLFTEALTNQRMSGPVNGVSPQPVRNMEFTKALGRVLHRPAILPVPSLALRLLYGEMAGVMLEGQRVLPVAAGAAGFSFRYPDVNSALAACVGTHEL